MAIAKTKEETLRHMRLLWLAYLATIPLFIYAATIGGFPWLNIRNAKTIFEILGVLDLLYFAWIRVSRYSHAVEEVREHSEDLRIIRRWMVVWTILVAVAEAEAIFGVCLQMQDKALKPALPFFVLAFLLLLTLWPRQIWSPEITATRP